MYEPTPAPAPTPSLTPASPSVKGGKRKTKGYNSLVSTKATNSKDKDKSMEGSHQGHKVKKPNTTHYLAAEMGLDTNANKKAKRFRKRSPSPSLDNLPSLETNYEYEHRTVNSIADESDYVDDLLPIHRKRLKRKPELIDSEVDLMKTKGPRLPLRMFLPRRLPPINENMSEVTEVINKTPKNRRKKLNKSSTSTPGRAEMTKTSSIKSKRMSAEMKKNSEQSTAQNDPTEMYPVLKNQALVKKFLQVDFTNNQKGRIRQVIKDILRGTSPTILPEVINSKIQAILKSSENLTDTDLRKIRVLYNMLKKATDDMKQMMLEAEKTNEVGKDKTEEDGDKKGQKDKEKLKKESKGSKETEEKAKKKKTAPGLRRYVVFVGNLPLHVTREQILNHFSDIREYIKDVRIPQLSDDKKSSYAYVELDNAPIYEMALSKHHSMMGSKRINVLYTKPNKNSKISKTVAKAKSAKLMAMAKKGQLIGSLPQQKKRSHRRAKAKAYQRAAEAGIDLNSSKLKSNSMKI